MNYNFLLKLIKEIIMQYGLIKPTLCVIAIALVIRLPEIIQALAKFYP